MEGKNQGKRVKAILGQNIEWYRVRPKSQLLCRFFQLKKGENYGWQDIKIQGATWPPNRVDVREWGKRNKSSASLSQVRESQGGELWGEGKVKNGSPLLSIFSSETP